MILLDWFIVNDNNVTKNGSNITESDDNGTESDNNDTSLLQLAPE